MKFPRHLRATFLVGVLALVLAAVLLVRNEGPDRGAAGAASLVVSECPAAGEDVASTTSEADRPSPHFKPLLPRGGIFGPASVWRTDVTKAPIAENSAGLVDNLAGQVERYYGGVAGFNSWAFNNSFYTVGDDVPRCQVAFDDCQGKGYTPEQLYDPAAGAHFSEVPIPLQAVAARGTDQQLSIYDPATDQLWEFWQASRTPTGWQACWGGRIDDVSHAEGIFPDGMGALATGLAFSDGVVGIADVEAGAIDHALYLTVVEAAHFTELSWPAQRSDGNQPEGTPDAIREGQRFRLDPSLDIAGLGLTPIAEVIARAAQTYGFIVADTGGAVTVGAESGANAAALNGGVDPWTALQAGVAPESILKDFPWRSLQALPVDHGKPR